MEKLKITSNASSEGAGYMADLVIPNGTAPADIIGCLAAIHRVTTMKLEELFSQARTGEFSMDAYEIAAIEQRVFPDRQVEHAETGRRLLSMTVHKFDEEVKVFVDEELLIAGVKEVELLIETYAQLTCKVDVQLAKRLEFIANQHHIPVIVLIMEFKRRRRELVDSYSSQYSTPATNEELVSPSPSSSSTTVN